jgi:hypothetical protein
MKTVDLIRFVGSAMLAHRLRSFLTAFGICVGIAAVILLTSLGAGLREFVVAEFTQFGTNIVNINPGKTQTQGMSIGIFGTVRPLTVEDSQALARLPGVIVTNPSVAGNAEVGAMDAPSDGAREGADSPRVQIRVAQASGCQRRSPQARVRGAGRRSTGALRRRQP